MTCGCMDCHERTTCPSSEVEVLRDQVASLEAEVKNSRLIQSTGFDSLTQAIADYREQLSVMTDRWMEKVEAEQDLMRQVVKYRNALKAIIAEVGTSTLTNKIACAALSHESNAEEPK